MAKRWMIEPPSADLEQAAKRWGVPSLVAQILLNRDVTPDDAGLAFLSPRLADLHPPDRLSGALAAADIIVSAIRAGRKIVLYGDYDVDGTTGVAILWHILTEVGASPTFYVPHRVEEGYGLNMGAVSRLAEEGAQLVVSIDCGITALEEAAEFRRRGVQLVITDHHTLARRFPTRMR